MKRQTIAKKMMRGYFGVVLLAAICILFTIVFMIVRNLQIEDKYQSNAKLSSIGRQLGDQVSLCDNGLQSLAFNATLQEFLSHDYKTTEDIEYYLQNINNITNLFTVAGFLVSDMGGQYTLYQQNDMPERSPYIYDGTRIAEFSFFDSLLQEDDRLRQTYIYSENGMLYMVKSVFMLQDQTFLGYLVFSASVDRFFSLAKDMLLANESLQVRLQGGEQVYSAAEENVSHRYSASATEKNGFMNITLQYDSYGSSDMLVRLILLYSLLMLLLFVFLVIYLFRFIRSISSRIENVHAKVMTISNGNFQVKVEEDDDDEIGELAKGVNSMTENINRLIEEDYKKKIRMRDAEFELLQNQIKPHFLYNTLSMLRWKAEEQGNMQLSELILNLAKFYRTSLSDGRSVISVRDEIQNISGYLYIQNCMHDESLLYEFAVKEAVKDKKIPKMSLQPIVENCIEHGLFPVAEGKIALIRITGDIRDDKTVLEIYDNGKGIPSNKISGILLKDSGGFGLKNIDAQIKNQFGPEFGLKIESKYGEYTKVYVILPA